jgi:hypothetical protein
MVIATLLKTRLPNDSEAAHLFRLRDGKVTNVIKQPPLGKTENP